MKNGCWYREGKGRFTVWAPLKESVTLQLTSGDKRQVPMVKDDKGYWSVTVDDISETTEYLYRCDDADAFPDPSSFDQPYGVHKPSRVYDHQKHQWNDAGWQPPALSDYIIYELHIGAFTPQGTFAGARDKLDYLVDLGITAVEVMPVAQFPGARNWGYDGAYLFAVQNSYGGPEEMKRFIDACHQKGLAVILDVVYNHLGPEGNYLACFAPYFTDRYQTPWGQAVNFDGSFSDGVREYFIENALYWLKEFHVDALRLDAVHGIYDFSATHILEEMQQRVTALSKAMGHPFHLIAESDLNNPRLIDEVGKGGYGLAGQWCDDFHHALRTLVTDDRFGYYQDFGDIDQLAKAIEKRFVYDGMYSSYRKKTFGRPADHRPADQFVAFCQNHDQVGNRMRGERLTALTDFESCKLAAGCYLLSAFIPLIFMGEEFAEDSPFLYFIDHGDPDLIEAVRRGRKEEFAAFHWKGDPPDPQSEETFEQSKLHWSSATQSKHAVMLQFYRDLISLRKQFPAVTSPVCQHTTVKTDREKMTLAVHRRDNEDAVMIFMNFDQQEQQGTFYKHKGDFQRVLCSADSTYSGPGAKTPEKITAESAITLPAHSLSLYQRIL